MNMGDRIKQIRQHYELNQTEFGAKIGMKQAAIGLWENGQRSVSDSSIMLICSKFGVNEKWLVDGDGEMFPTAGSDIEFEDIWTNIRVANTENADFIKRIVRAYWSLSADKQAVIMELIDKISEK